MLQLQRAIGNRGVAQLLRATRTSVQREPEKEEEELQLKPEIPAAGLEGGPVPPDVESFINRKRPEELSDLQVD